MALREPAPIPAAFDFTRFLASSLTFMVHLLEVSVFMDGMRLSKLTKDSGVAQPATIPKGLKVSSPQGIMQVTGIHTTRMLLVQVELGHDADITDIQPCISRLK